MKQRFYTDYLFKFSLVVSAILFNTASASVEGKPVKTTPVNSSKTTFSVQSNLAPNVSIPADYYWNQFGCSGDNLAPRLTWEHAPKGTKVLRSLFTIKMPPLVVASGIEWFTTFHQKSINWKEA